MTAARPDRAARGKSATRKARGAGTQVAAARSCGWRFALRKQNGRAAGAVAVAVGAGLAVAACASARAPSAETRTGAAAGPAGGTPVAEEAAETSVAAIYSESQAARGRASFEEVCSECHTTGEFRGMGFQANWGRRTVYSLFRTMRSTMPDDNPGGLEEAVYLDVVAYILKMNGHAAGPEDLAADSPMRDVRVAPPEPGS